MDTVSKAFLRSKKTVPTSAFCSKIWCHSSVTVSKADVEPADLPGRNPHWFGDRGQNSSTRVKIRLFFKHLANSREQRNWPIIETCALLEDLGIGTIFEFFHSCGITPLMTE